MSKSKEEELEQMRLLIDRLKADKGVDVNVQTETNRSTSYSSSSTDKPERKWHFVNFTGQLGWLLIAAIVIVAYRFALAIMTLVDHTMGSNIPINTYAILMAVLISLDLAMLLSAVIVWICMAKNNNDERGSGRYFGFVVFLCLMVFFSIIQVVMAYNLAVRFTNLSPLVVDERFKSDLNITPEPLVMRIYSMFDAFVSFSLMSYAIAFYVFFRDVMTAADGGRK